MLYLQHLENSQACSRWHTTKQRKEHKCSEIKNAFGLPITFLNGYHEIKHSVLGEVLVWWKGWEARCFLCVYGYAPKFMRTIVVLSFPIHYIGPSYRGT